MNVYLLKNIYALICAVIPFECELIRTSNKITRDTITNDAFGNFADNTSKCNRTVIDGSMGRCCIAIVTNERALLSGSDQPVQNLGRHRIFCM